MDFCKKEYSFPSKTGIADIFVSSVAPEEKENIKGIISIVHGMAEHSGRYTKIAEYIASHGYAVFMHDHAGHGKSVESEDDLGYFGDTDGYKKITDDVKEVIDIAKKEYPDVPVTVWGHSMGSFVTRLFISAYKDAADAAVICGTSGANPAAGAGILVAKSVAKLLGTRHRSDFLDSMAFGSYNKKFDGDTGFEWLSVNKKNIDDYVKDDLCGYRFTAFGFKDLFSLLASVSSKEWYENVPKTLPLYLIAGDTDPVGNYGKGVKEVYERLQKSGHTDVEIKLYEGYRHEIHNEDIRYEVLDGILKFTDRITK